MEVIPRRRRGGRQAGVLIDVTLPLPHQTAVGGEAEGLVRPREFLFEVEFAV